MVTIKYFLFSVFQLPLWDAPCIHVFCMSIKTGEMCPFVLRSQIVFRNLKRMNFPKIPVTLRDDVWTRGHVSSLWLRLDSRSGLAYKTIDYLKSWQNPITLRLITLLKSEKLTVLLKTADISQLFLTAHRHSEINLLAVLSVSETMPNCAFSSLPNPEAPKGAFSTKMVCPAMRVGKASERDSAVVVDIALQITSFLRRLCSWPSGMPMPFLTTRWRETWRCCWLCSAISPWCRMRTETGGFSADCCIENAV